VQWSAIPLAGIERIEIMRGTGAVLYGDAASAGVVNIVTRSPLLAGRRLEAFGRAGSLETLEGQLYGSAANDVLGVNGSVYGYASDGYRDNNRNEQQNATLNLRWALGEGALDLRFAKDQQDLRLPGARRVRPSIGLDEYADDPRGAQTPLDFSSRDGTRAGLALTQRFGDTEVSIGLDRRDKDQRSYFDFGGFPSYRADDLQLTSFTPRVRTAFTLGATRHRLTLGFDMHSWRYDSRRTTVPENLGRPVNRVSIDQDTRGVYLQDVIDLSAATVLTVGARRERAKYEGNDVADPGAPNCLFCVASAAPSAGETQKQRAWDIGVRHALNARWAAFARASRSFRFVNAEEIYENDVFFAPQFQILRPQHARTREAGAEWRRGERALRATLFQSDVSDEIHLDPFLAGVGNTNLPRSRRRGVELDGQMRPREALRLTAAYAYTDAKFLEGSLAGEGIEGARVPLVPRHKLNFGASWNVTPRAQLSAILTAVSSQVLDNDESNTFFHRIPGFAVLDLKVAQRFDGVRLAFAVNNVLDKDYYTYAVRSAFTPGLYSVYPLPGRAFSLTAEVTLP
jgi:iron complex outermembrane recepter protein